MPDSIPALTLWQPWAALIAIGAKPFETRSWPTHYRGPLAIHAGIDRRGLAWCRGAPGIEAALGAAGLTLDTLPLGGIVAVAELIQCWPTEDIVADDLADPFGDYGDGRFGWHLARVRPLREPIPCAGRQRLWTPPAAVQAQLRALLASPKPAVVPTGARRQAERCA
ncbi:ASCH domain-containing protein [Thiohalocapsa halophila]|uniref:ASCH domain-containing protein n=1 Tax=Thiohalocapsa halophila TaxID=69359 RepID=UPI0019085412|nr:ASCH domain-containing protein [Thiohalocapsa halophila]